MGVYKKSLANAILFALEKTIDGYIRVEDFAYHHYRYHYGIPDLKKSSLSQALKKLREAGKDLISNQFEEKHWDGKWRVVIFDIPEEKRIIRNLFRRNLKKWGFKHLQKSVWISKRNVYDKLNSYIKDLGIEKWVIVMEINRLTCDITT